MLLAHGNLGVASQLATRPWSRRRKSDFFVKRADSNFECMMIVGRDLTLESMTL